MLPLLGIEWRKYKKLEVREQTASPHTSLTLGPATGIENRQQLPTKTHLTGNNNLPFLVIAGEQVGFGKIHILFQVCLPLCEPESLKLPQEMEKNDGIHCR